MEWYIVCCDKDNSFVLVERKAIISAGSTDEVSLKVGDFATVIYGRKPYLGKIMAISSEYFQVIFP